MRHISKSRILFEEIMKEFFSKNFFKTLTQKHIRDAYEESLISMKKWECRVGDISQLLPYIISESQSNPEKFGCHFSKQGFNKYVAIPPSSVSPTNSLEEEMRNCYNPYCRKSFYPANRNQCYCTKKCRLLNSAFKVIWEVCSNK